MDIKFRAYKKSDYSCCENLVNDAWGFDKLFKSTNLQTIAKCLYTKGSESSSNYKVVATYNDTVVGFIYGVNCAKRKPKWGLFLGLKATFDLNFKKMDKLERQKFVEAITEHHKNRLDASPEKANEIILFVVNDKYQGMGIGKKLWRGFRDFCLESGDGCIRVETNLSGASAFYEKSGFKHKLNFHSPLHNLATPDGQACLYEYTHEI